MFWAPLKGEMLKYKFVLMTEWNSLKGSNKKKSLYGALIKAEIGSGKKRVICLFSVHIAEYLRLHGFQIAEVHLGLFFQTLGSLRSSQLLTEPLAV